MLAEVTVAPITTTIRNIPSEVALNPEDGMPRECAVNLDHLQTVSKVKIGAYLTTLNTQKMEAVKAALNFAFGF